MQELHYLGGSNNLELIKEAARHESIFPNKDTPVYVKDDKGKILFTYYNGQLVR